MPKKTTAKKILVIGAGGTGGWVIQALHFNYDLFVLDEDIFEDSNFARQYGVVDEHKVDYYKKWLEIDGENEWFTVGTPNKQYDLVICVADNNQTRHDALQWAEQHEVPVIIGGNEKTSGEAILYVPGSTPLSWPECYWDREATPDPRQVDCVKEATDGGQTVMANMCCASLIVNMVQKFFDEPRDYTDFRPYINYHMFGKGVFATEIRDYQEYECMVRAAEEARS